MSSEMRWLRGVSYNVSDYLDFDDRTEWLIANHGTQALAFDIPNVAKAAAICNVVTPPLEPPVARADGETLSIESL